MWEIYFCDTDTTVHWSTKECVKFFGEREFMEIKQGYSPHIVAAWIDGDQLETLPGFLG